MGSWRLFRRAPFGLLFLAPAAGCVQVVTVSGSPHGPAHSARTMRGPSTTATATGAKYSAVVTGRQARMEFPLAERRSWTWHQEATPTHYLEYGWTAEVVNGERLFQVGFLLFKPPGARQTSGELGALLRAGQQRVARAEGSGRSLLPEAQVRVEHEPGTLAVVVDDPRTLELLFSSRPTRALMTVKLPDEPSVTREVLIEYRP